MTLQEAIDYRLRQAKLTGWRLSRRRHIEIEADGTCRLRLGWLDNTELRKADADEPDIDTTGLESVTAYIYSPPPDTVDVIEPAPTESDIQQAAADLGCRYLDRGKEQGRTVYWMIK